MSNLKPAPFSLTPDLVAKLTGDQPAFGKGIERVPMLGRVNEFDRPAKIDPRDIPSSMEQLAESWGRRCSRPFPDIQRVQQPSKRCWPKVGLSTR
jgi:hypothetical protein